MRGSPITACVNYENAYRDLLLASQSVAHVSASLPAPGDETLFQRSHAQVETPCDNADKHDAHDNHVRAQKARSIEHHLPEARSGRDHLGGDQCGPPEPDGDASARQNFGQRRR